MTNKIIGKYGEGLAKNFLIKNGFKILEMNFKYSKLSEIDIIAYKNNSIHFVEVKTRSTLNFGAPFEAVNRKKLLSIFQCAQFYLKNTNVKYKRYQIDVIGIILNNNIDNDEPEFQFIENISL